jgi:hypothetical protein
MVVGLLVMSLWALIPGILTGVAVIITLKLQMGREDDAARRKYDYEMALFRALPWSDEED